MCTGYTVSTVVCRLPAWTSGDGMALLCGSREVSSSAKSELYAATHRCTLASALQSLNSSRFVPSFSLTGAGV